jgi:hypothetical protein
LLSTVRGSGSLGRAWKVSAPSKEEQRENLLLSEAYEGMRPSLCVVDIVNRKQTGSRKKPSTSVVIWQFPKYMNALAKKYPLSYNNSRNTVNISF